MVTTTGPGTPDTTDVESMPTLVIHCDRDRAVPPEEGRLLAAEIPGARYVSLPSANHLIEEEPAWSQFLEELGVFVNW
jgi:pimeloyl-ACP methyl ester carboxylesterase